MARQRTVTTPGSYQAPVEGIVDYGAFQKGFDRSFSVPIKEEKEQEKVEQQTMDLYGGGVWGDNTVNPSLLNQKLTDKVKSNSDIFANPKTTNEQKQGLNLENTGFSSAIGTLGSLNNYYNNKEENNFDASALGEIIQKQGFSVSEIATTLSSGNYGLSSKEINGVKTFGIEVEGEDGVKKYLDLTYQLNDTVVKGATELRSDKILGNAVGKFKADTKDKIFEVKQQYKSGLDEKEAVRQSRQYNADAIVNAETSASDWLNNNQVYEAGIFNQASSDMSSLSQEQKDFIFGTKDEQGRPVQQGFGSVWDTDVKGDKYKKVFNQRLDVVLQQEGINKEDFLNSEGEEANSQRKAIFSQVEKGIDDMKMSINKAYVENEMLKSAQGFFSPDQDQEVRVGSSEYNANKRYYDDNFEANNGVIVLKKGRAYPKKDMFETTKFGKPDTDSGSGSGSGSAVGIVEDLNTQFNAITSDAEREFSKPGYAAGTTRGGEGQAPQMFNFLTNKSYMKGGSEKSIDNVEYRIIGEGEDRKVLLDIFSTSSGKEDKLATVDLSDTVARRDFLTNIGQGLAVTSKEKQEVRDETTRLTQSREKAFDVFKDISVGDKNSSRWNVLAKAVRDNSSEGLNAEERKAFLKAGYGKK